MPDQNVLLNIHDRVATITLNRATVFNSLDLPMADALVRVIQTCAEDVGTRVVILTGVGHGFCAGGDMKAAWEHVQRGGDPQHFFRDLTALLHRAITDLRLMEKPVIAAVNGVTCGAGVSLAAACDLRLAAESARFKQAYTSIGLVPDGGWTAIMPQIIGAARAMHLLLIDPMLSAEQALAMDLVHEVVPDGRLTERTHELANKLALGSSTAFASGKVLMNAVLFPALEVQMERERQRIIAQGGKSDFLEGLSAFVEKRSPHFP